VTGTACGRMTNMPEPASEAVDIAQLAAMLNKRRKDEGKSLRDVAAETGVPFTTLARVESGRLPDLTTFRNIVIWLGIPPERFFPTTKVKQETTPDAIARVLHADSSLSEQAREQLSSVVAQMYAAITIQSQVVKVNIRADRTFTPEAGNALSDLLHDMQRIMLSEEGRS
jgi:transcriptional regulator with XRE-family HTH domain